MYRISSGQRDKHRPANWPRGRAGLPSPAPPSHDRRTLPLRLLAVSPFPTFLFQFFSSAAPHSESNFWRTLCRSSTYTFCRLLPGSLRVNLLSCNGVQRAPLSIIWSPLYHFMQFPSITFRSVPLCNTAALPFSRSNNALLRNFPQRLSRKISHTPESHIGSTFTH